MSRLCAAELPADTLLLEDVTVSAVKKAGNAAAAVTFVARPEIESARVLSPRDVTAFAPNVFIPDYGSRMTSTIYVRGIGARIDQPSLCLTIDNVPVLSKDNYDVDLMEMSRVEVLRGPQSALYGRNAMAGVMNVTTTAAGADPGTRVLLEGASRMAFKAGVAHSRRTSDRFALAANVYFTSRGGEYRNEYNGKLTDWERQGSARLKMEWRPSARFTITNTLWGGHSRQGGYPYEWTQTGQIAYNDTCFYRRTNIMDGLTINFNTDWGTITAITSYQFLDDNMTLDQDFTPMPYFTLTQARTEHAVTQEVIVKHGDGSSVSATSRETEEPSPLRVEWLAGAFGFYRSMTMTAPVTFKDTGIAELIENHRNAAAPDYPIAWHSRQMLLGSDFKMPSHGVAAYGQVTFHLGDWILDAGLRLDYERVALDYHSETHSGYDVMHGGSVYASTPIDIDDGGHMSRSFTQLLPRVAVSRGWQGGKAWVSVGKSYKAGGFNTQMFSDVLQQRLMGMMGISAAYDADRIVGYKPEVAWNYEAGARLDRLAGGRLTVEANAFWIDCRDRQLTTFPDGTTTGRVMTNAGRTRSVGVEAQATLRLTDATVVAANYGFTDARFVRYHDGRNDYRHRFVPYAPRHTLFASARHRFDVNRSWLHAVELGARVNAAGPIAWNEANTMTQRFYALLGADVTLRSNRWSLQLWGTNLTGTRYATFYFVSIGHEFLQRGRSRAFGATLRLDF